VFKISLIKSLNITSGVLNNFFEHNNSFFVQGLRSFKDFRLKAGFIIRRLILN